MENKQTPEGIWLTNDEINEMYPITDELKEESEISRSVAKDIQSKLKDRIDSKLLHHQKANAKLVEVLRELMNDIDPENWCRGKFEHLTGDKNKAYVGGKRAPSDESIVAAMELLQTYETK